MVKKRINIVNKLGLHARAAAQLVRLASGFSSRIRLLRPDNSVIADAKSILSVLTLAAGLGVALEVEVEGSDEDAALDAIEKLFSEGFGEL